MPTTNVTVTPRDNGPMTIFFVVDQGANAVYNNFSAFSLGAMRKVMSRLIDGGFFAMGAIRSKCLCTKTSRSTTIGPCRDRT